MAPSKHIDFSPRLMALDFERQLLPGTFEHALHLLLGSEIYLSHFGARFRNDLVGTSACSKGRTRLWSSIALPALSIEIRPSYQAQSA